MDLIAQLDAYKASQRRSTEGPGAKSAPNFMMLPESVTAPGAVWARPSPFLRWLEDGAGLDDRVGAPAVFLPDEVLLLTAALRGVRNVAQQCLRSGYTPGTGFGTSLPLLRLLTGLGTLLPRRLRLLEISPAGSWFGMFSVLRGHQYIATEAHPLPYQTIAMNMKYFCGADFCDTSVEEKVASLGRDATLIPWWQFVAFGRDVPFGVDVVVLREPLDLMARYDVHHVLRTSRALLKASPLALFITTGCRNRDYRSGRPMPLLDDAESFGFKPAFDGPWHGYAVAEATIDSRLHGVARLAATAHAGRTSHAITAERLLAHPLCNDAFQAPPET